MFMQNIIKLSAAVHELSCRQAFLPYLAMVKNPKIRVIVLRHHIQQHHRFHHVLDFGVKSRHLKGPTSFVLRVSWV